MKSPTNSFFRIFFIYLFINIIIGFSIISNDGGYFLFHLLYIIHEDFVKLKGNVPPKVEVLVKKKKKLH